LRELAELLQAPVFTTMSGKSGFPEDHPLALGAGGRTRPKAVMHFLKKADLVFAIGRVAPKNSAFSRKDGIIARRSRRLRTVAQGMGAAALPPTKHRSTRTG
jgi:thiamine pyrophosphate-dependent acetolactate synthase large subunit-like protein